MTLPWSDLFVLARTRHRGVIVPADGEPFGIGTRALRRRAAADAWVEPHPRTWLLPGVPLTADVRALAGCRAIGGRVLATGWTAAALMGLAEPPSRPQLLLPHDRRIRQGLAGIDVVRSRNIAARDTLRIDHVPATTLPRTALALAAAGTDDVRLRDLVIDGIQQRRATLGDLVDLLDRSRGSTGRPRLDRVVRQLLRDQVDSGLELDTRRVVARAGLRPHPAPFPLRCRDGRVVHLDAAFPEVWHTIECDGAGAHMDRRRFETDRVRWSQIQRTGVTITWVTRRRLDDDPGGILEELHEAHAGADPERPPLRPAHDCRQRCGRR